MALHVQDCTAERLNDVRALFEEYAASVGTGLCFEDFGRELASLPNEYAAPTGRLLVAADKDGLAGCVALRRIDEQICEMKRLYVRLAYRRRGLGRLLAQTAIAAARDTGYSKMRLDTLPSMKAAIGLYHSLGFVDIPPYRFNSVDGVKYMELTLARQGLRTSMKPPPREPNTALGRRRRNVAVTVGRGQA